MKYWIWSAHVKCLVRGEDEPKEIFFVRSWRPIAAYELAVNLKLGELMKIGKLIEINEEEAALWLYEEK